ncbi:uncharacterized protein LOC144621247 [Crassostrea virginica]
MLDDASSNDLPDLVDVSVNGEPSPSSSPLSGTSDSTTGNPGEEVVVNVVFKDQDDSSPVGKITVTTQNVEKIIFTIVTPDDTTVTKEETIEQPTVETTITTDFTGETAKSVQIQLVPSGDEAVVSVRDVGIEACIEKEITTTLPSVQTPTTTPSSGPPSGPTSTSALTTTPMSEYANSDETNRGLIAPEKRVEVLPPLNQAFSSPTPLINLSYSNDCFSVFLAYDLPDLVDVSVNGEPSPTSSPLSGTSETTRGNPGEEVVIDVIFKDENDESPIGKITVTTQNVKKVILTIVKLDNTTVTKEETTDNPTGQKTVVTDFTGETATAVQIKLVPADDQAVVSVKDVDIEACIEKGKHMFGAVLRQYKRKNSCGVDLQCT